MSASKPSATTNPTWNRDSSGSAISTLNVAASTRPALVITPPVRSSAAMTAASVVAARALLADAREQEDVVVDPERHQEDERELLEALVARGLAHHVREDQRAHAERETERQDHGRDDVERHDHRAQEHARG